MVMCDLADMKVKDHNIFLFYGITWYSQFVLMFLSQFTIS